MADAEYAPETEPSAPDAAGHAAGDSGGNGQGAMEAGAESGAGAGGAAADELPGYLAWLEGYPALQALFIAGVVIALAAGLHLLTRWVLLWFITRVVSRIPTWWVAILREHRALERLVPAVPAVVIHEGANHIPHLPMVWQHLIQRLAVATIVLVVARGLGALISAANDIYLRYPIARGRPIKGYLQVVKIVIYAIAIILILAALMDQSPLIFLSGLGAMTAIIMLIFRETILSFVAGIQLVNNDLVRVGDWIEMPQFDADGDVIDISLNVVKVQNWDRTHAMIPTHKFLEHSFRNWRSMHESGGRRIKRAVHLDMTSIRFLSEDEIRYFSRFVLLSDYMQRKATELDTYNRQHCPQESADVIANARHLTNVGTFRAYVIEYLRRHPQIHKQMTFLVRQLAPTPQGLPIEVYVFTTDTIWAKYEAIQADIFDHILSIVPEFGLRLFQEPSGHDLTGLARALGNGQAATGKLHLPGPASRHENIAASTARTSPAGSPYASKPSAHRRTTDTREDD